VRARPAPPPQGLGRARAYMLTAWATSLTAGARLIRDGVTRRDGSACPTGPQGVVLRSADAERYRRS